MPRARRVVAVVALTALAACGDPSPAPSDAAHTSRDESSVATPTSETHGEQPTMNEAEGPSKFFFIVDGPLVTNGPPWNCVTAGTECGAQEGGFSGTIELVDDCIVVQGSDSPPGYKSVVVFRFGVSWDDATQTIRGLRPDPVAIGDEISVLAVSDAQPDAWTQSLGLPEVPEKVRECMETARADRILYNTPWTGNQSPPLVTVHPETTPPPST